MTTPEAPPRTLIYHFTHLDNMESILAAGHVACDILVRQQATFTEVGDAAIKDRRRQRVIPVDPGGTVADYVPFYFAPRSPMMFRIFYDHRDATPDRYPAGVDPLVYLVSSVETIVSAGLTWVGSDGNSTMDPTRFTTDLPELVSLVDWPLMTEKYWKNTPEDGDRVRRRAAEFLVHQRVPLSAILGYAVRTGQRAEELAEVLARHGQQDSYVAVRPEWYP
jgi:ssDNA thymidine ADP-ribosyltransferase, DarT